MDVTATGMDKEKSELMDEVGRLCKLLSERELELKILRRRVEEVKVVDSAGAVGASDAAVAKIVELSRKARELSSELQKEKVRAQCAEKKLQETQTQQRLLEERTCGVITDNSSIKQMSDMDEVKSLQEKLRAAETRVTESRNHLQSVKTELRLTQKVLSQEVGEGVQIQTLVGAGSTAGWKGRAQQIAILQRKITDLKKLLHQSHQSISAGQNIQSGASNEKCEGSDIADLTTSDQLYGEFDAVRGSLVHPVDVMNEGVSVDKPREEIRRIERQRKDNFERAEMNLRNLEQQHDDLKLKSEALKARNKTLSGEVKIFRTQIESLKVKGRHDDELISALLKQQAELKQTLLEVTRKTNDNVSGRPAASGTDVTEKQKDLTEIERLGSVLAEKETKLKEMQDRLGMLEQARSGSSASSMMRLGSSGPDGDVRLSPDDISRIVAVDKLSALSTHKYPRISSEITRLGDELSNDEIRLRYDELLALFQATAVERDKFFEYIQVLQKRIEEMTLKNVEYENTTHEHRRKSALLEKQIESLRVGQVQNSTPRRVKSKESSGSTKEHLSLTPEALKQLQLELDIKSDDIQSLRVALRSTLKAKHDDLKYFTDLISENKKIFLQTLQHFHDRFTKS